MHSSPRTLGTSSSSGSMNAARRPGSALPLKVHPISSQQSKLHARTVSFDASTIDLESLSSSKHTASQPTLSRPRSLSNAQTPQSSPLPLTTYTSPPYKNRLSLTGVSAPPPNANSVASPKSASAGTPKANRSGGAGAGASDGNESFDFSQSKIAERYHKRFKAPLVPDQAMLKNDVSRSILILT